MQRIAWLFFAGFALAGCGQDKDGDSVPSEVDERNASPVVDRKVAGEWHGWDNPETRDERLALAIAEDTLEVHGQRGEALSFPKDKLIFYAPNEQIPYTGWAKTMLDNGQVGSLNLFKDGKKDGTYAVWHENGEIRVAGHFKADALHGPFITGYANGQKKMEGQWKNGQADGLWTYWYGDDLKRKVGQDKDGKMDGRWIHYKLDGAEDRRETWKAGKKIETIYPK